MAMTAALVDLTPVAVQFIPEPLITWADLRGLPFTEPFFRETLTKVAPERSRALSGIDELRALDDRPTLRPALFIFHSSRCGSTLLSQMLATAACHVVVSEPPALNSILASRSPPAEQAELVRLVLRAMGRNRGSEARHLIVKFTSWNVLAAAAIHRQFPDTPMLWLQRAPLEVLASHTERPAGWFSWRQAGDRSLGMFGLTVDEAQAMTPARFRSRAVEALYRAVHEARLPFRVVDYTQLPQALWEEIARRAGLSFSGAEVERMRARARFDAKGDESEDHRLFVPRDRTALLASDERRYIEERIAPLYRALAHHEAQPGELA